jgi:putative Mg2+ transporter-C (MgtC) family protein
MNVILEELSKSLPDAHEVARVTIRLLAALIAGAIVGLQREHSHAPAGLRTHMLVSMGVTLFVFMGVDVGMGQDAQSRVLQGIATGVGFLGAGAILKMKDSLEVHGLTTAAGIWMTAAIGVAIGFGRLGVAAIGVAFAWFVLAIVVKTEARPHRGGENAEP